MLDKTTKNLLITEINKILPEDSQNRLISAVRYVLLAPAKHIRPFLVVASSQVFNVEIERVISIAMAVECIHTYSLIHDDLPCMDNSDTRRGQLSCHKRFDKATAVLAGDALLTLAFEILSSLNEGSNKRCEIIKALSQAIGAKGMVGGQILDIKTALHVIQHHDYLDPESSVINEHTRQLCNKNRTLGSCAKITPDSKIKEIHLMKTAKLFAASCEIGAIIGSATDKQRRALYNYGVNLGLIFQAKDDIRDYKQDEVNNLMSMLSKSEIENYIDNLFKQALDNLGELSGDTNYLYNLLNQVKRDD
ncbi:polyprenyl synthetase family protein [Wolbachia endosymbiont of Brugia malayi]|uniref:polyprenyl synthetase family protein n=1 Tax=Wolbachia endosymbiont of Brugia malayi TaxID=80849 RepID=UPI00004C94EC|nr:polyprenyl synthetase family protein [Wolbachia endosymbiont of Brugia malayi]AAW71325.1 Geranylgeranyl pyrophosphate synthase [Wolbachia endosymbiont strain TRS of Brugia malayi]QCB61517.1 polyprenyl synthetase family protein [Wolbachia endosymbiont of Brugia malayi]